MVNLAEWRKSRNLSQKQLGDLIGKDQTTISSYEKGRIPVPEDVIKALKTLGYEGAAVPLAQDIGHILDEAEAIITELKRRGFRAASQDQAQELRKLVAEEVRDSHTLGRPEPVADRVERWWRLAEARRK